MDTSQPDTLPAQPAEIHTRILTAFQRITEGDFSSRLPLDGPASLRPLCAGFNAMVAALERTHAELTSSERRYRGIVESQLELLVRVDPAGHFTFVNDAYCTLFGRSRDSLLGSSFTPLVHPDDLPHTMEAFHTLQHPPYRCSVEQRALTARGWRWLQWEDCVIFDGRGALLEIQAVGRDITERKSAEEALRASEERHRMLIEHLPAVTYTMETGAPPRLIFLSQHIEQWMGYPAAEWYANPRLFYAIMHPDDRPKVAEAWRRQWWRAQPTLTLDYRMYTRDARLLWLQDTVAAAYDERGTLLRFTGVLLDITAQKQAEVRQALIARMEESACMKSEFLSMVSHELRTPLTPIRGIIDLLASEHLGPLNPDQQKSLDIAQRQTMRLQSLINDLLEYSALDSGRLLLQREPFDLAACVTETRAAYAEAFAERALTLQFEIAPDVPFALVDRHRIVQVVNNLLDNALKFTPTGGVTLRVLRGALGVRLEVADTGIGLAPEHCEVIFDRFFQVAPQLTRRHGGTGLGLAIVRQLVDAHGGTIRVESPGIGAGSTFIVELPGVPAAQAE